MQWRHTSPERSRPLRRVGLALAGWPVGAGIHASRDPLRRHKHPGRDKSLPYALPANHLLHDGASGTPPPTHCPQTAARRYAPGRALRGCERGATVERSETGERTMFAPAGQTTARAGQLCWLAALVVRRQAPGPYNAPQKRRIFVCAPGHKLHNIYYFLFIICTIRGMIYLTPISITKRSDPF